MGKNIQCATLCKKKKLNMHKSVGSGRQVLPSEPGVGKINGLRFNLEFRASGLSSAVFFSSHAIFY